jgi:N-alpha-acetyl-L-2,4-diaminobutyrate deacetylase
MAEPLVDLGGMVERGDPLMRIWSITHTGEAADTVLAQKAGLLTGRHFPGLSGMGDCLAVVATVD